MRRMRLRRRSARSTLVGLLLAAATSSACGVEAYERGTLARRDMAPTAQPEQTAGEEHAREFREGSVGGGRVQSGGCGCN